VTLPIVDREQFVAFLLNAKRHTYAAQGDEATVTPLLNGSKQLEYSEGHWFYRDIYFGMAYFVGQETIYSACMPLWAMSYAGGLTSNAAPEDLHRMYSCLRAALRHVQPERPFRGPLRYVEGEMAYHDESEGDISRFAGQEIITESGVLVYDLHYSGGWLR
jgi:hypothetical protein